MSEIILAADTRISGMGTRGNIVVKQDVCQKLFYATPWCVVGFAGHVCLARHLLRGFLSKIRATSPMATAWLESDEEVLRFLRHGVEMHPKMRNGKGTIDHKDCTKQPIELLIAWVDVTRDAIGRSRDLADTRIPPRLETIRLSSPNLLVARKIFGIECIGSGSPISEPIRSEAYVDISWYANEHPQAEMQKAFLTASIARKLLEEARIDSVGEAFQLICLSRHGVRVIPYFYWVPVGDQNGTYVAMRIEGGEWVQEHRPTGTKIRIMSPFDFQLMHPDFTSGANKHIDPKVHFTSKTPGVVPDHNGRLVYYPYDPDDVHEEILRSWGSAPLTPNTWGADGDKKRKRRP
ncbi:MAG: hypothetical protein ACR2OE_17850 [Thermomicrobiales bacterium]